VVVMDQVHLHNSSMARQFFSL